MHSEVQITLTQNWCKRIKQMNENGLPVVRRAELILGALARVVVLNLNRAGTTFAAESLASNVITHAATIIKPIEWCLWFCSVFSFKLIFFSCFRWKILIRFEWVDAGKQIEWKTKHEKKKKTRTQRLWLNCKIGWPFEWAWCDLGIASEFLYFPFVPTAHIAHSKHKN